MQQKKAFKTISSHGDNYFFLLTVALLIEQIYHW